MTKAPLMAAVAIALGGVGAGYRLRRLNISVILSAAFLILLTVAAIFAPLVAPYNPMISDIMSNMLPPMSEGEPGAARYIFGTDVIGRDVFSGVIYGSRVSLTVAVAAVLGAGIIGTVLGLAAGYIRGAFDEVVMRLVDVQLAFPFIVLAIMLMYIMGPGLWNIVLALVIAKWPIYARVARAEAMSIATSDFVMAARSMGAGHMRIMFRHILPNALSPLAVVAAFAVPQMIVLEAALSFLGLGIPPEMVSWGSMLAAGRVALEQAWWVATFPGLAIMAAVLSINILVEALRIKLGASVADR